MPDANILLYAADASSPKHGPAKRWLEQRLSGSETFGLAWAVLLAFIRLSTNPRVFSAPLGIDEAFETMEGWLAQPCTAVVHPGERHAILLRELLDPHGTAGNLTSDAHLAALAIEHGAQLCSSDRDFSRFARLDWSDPLA